MAFFYLQYSTCSSCVKSLGVYIDQYLLFDTHIDKLVKKTIGVLYYLNRIKDRFDIHTRTMVVQVIVMSLLNCCLRIWGMTNRIQLDKVQKIQNFAAKVAVGYASKYDHVSPILEKLAWVRMDKKIFMDICVFKIFSKFKEG